MITAIPASELFPACRSVLENVMVPMHYKALASMAVDLIAPGKQASIKDIAEDLRGKGKPFPGRRIGMEYYPRAGFKVGMRHWFNLDEQFLGVISMPRIIVKGSLLSFIDAAIQAHVRLPFMMNKYGLSDAKRFEVALRGFIVETTVKQYFKDMWPLFYVNAENEGDIRSTCKNDFRLNVNGTVTGVDVATPKKDGTISKPRFKSPTDIHVFARLDERAEVVEILSFTTGDKYTELFSMWQQQPFDRLACWLNCKSEGINFSIFT